MSAADPPRLDVVAGNDHPIFEVLTPGLLTTVQDAGRYGYRALGVPVAGACDPVGLATANLVIGNSPGDAAIECTLVGPDFLILSDAVVGLGGADLGVRALPSGRRLLPGGAHRLAAGERLVVTGPADAAGADARGGCRAYVAVAGGIAVPVVLGSRSTSLVGGFGGFSGRALRAGDRLLSADPPAGPRPAPSGWPTGLVSRSLDDAVRILPGPALANAAGEGSIGEAHRALIAGSWRVTAASDRRGLRLEGRPIPAVGSSAAPSHGVLPGTIQLTPAGQPLVLLNDGGTTGGYPVIGVVIAADLGLIGQVRPGGRLDFRTTDLSAARAAAADLRARIGGARERLAAVMPDAWDDLAADARG